LINSSQTLINSSIVAVIVLKPVRIVVLTLCIGAMMTFMAPYAVAQGTSTFGDTVGLPQNLGLNVNSVYDDILPVIAPDGKTLYFCRSNNPDNIGGFGQDIWFSELQLDGKWGFARNIGIPLNNRGNNYLCSITPDGNTIIVGDAYSNPANKQRGFAASRRTATGWAVPQPVVIKNYYNLNVHHEFSLSNDGKTIIMAVERRDSRGGRDLYFSKKQPDSTWSEPVSLDTVVNSFGHEATPFIASDNSSLYFASDGHGGYGGFDVFVTRRLDSTWTNWSTPENLGPTINSSGWDLYYTIPASGDYAYYVSFANSHGMGDIFKVRLPEKMRPRPVVLITGRVLNKVTGEPIEADIFYELLPQGVEIGSARSTPTTGAYKIVLPAGNNYGFRASASGFLSVNDNIDLTLLTEYTEIKRDLYLVPIEVGSVAALNNIFFDYRVATLRGESFPEIDRIGKLLKENSAIIIEVGGHTDDRGSSELNQTLSEARARSVYDRLLLSGIERDRLILKGYGETRPIANGTSEEARQLNRRVEIVILKK